MNIYRELAAMATHEAIREAVKMFDELRGPNGDKIKLRKAIKIVMEKTGVNLNDRSLGNFDQYRNKGSGT